MKWSRNDEDVRGDAVVLKFPSGIQARLDLQGAPESDDDPPSPTETLEEQTPMPTPSAAPNTPVEPLGLSHANARALVAWHMAGLSLFAGRDQPTLRDAMQHARGVMLALAMESTGGNITHMAVTLNASRLLVRKHLRRLGLYDWSPVEDGEEEDREEEDREEEDREEEDREEEDREEEEDARELHDEGPAPVVNEDSCPA